MNSTDSLDDCFLTFHAFAGNAADGALPDETFPALVQVRPVVLDSGTPASRSPRPARRPPCWD